MSDEDHSTNACYRCGYALHGIADDQPCPECGLLARRSRRPSDELRYTRPRWLRRVSRGSNLLLAAIVLIVISPALSLMLMKVSNAMIPTPRLRWALPLIPLLGVDLAALLLLAGAWLLASPEGYPPADGADRGRRWLLRFVALAPLMLIATKNTERYLIANGGYWGVYDHDWSPIMLAMAAAMVASIPLPHLLFAQLRGIARRARSAHLAEHSTIVGIGASAMILVYLVFAAFVINSEEWGLGTRWIQRSPIALGIILATSVAALLFAIWSVYLLVRFAIAFRRTSRELSGAWRADDSAAADGSPAPAT